jgi:hypothetical protein
MVYRAIGKAAVKYAVLFLRQRYARPIKVGTGLAALAVGVAVAYWANRDVPEG